MFFADSACIVAAQQRDKDLGVKKKFVAPTGNGPNLMAEAQAQSSRLKPTANGKSDADAASVKVNPPFLLHELMAACVHTT